MRKLFAENTHLLVCKALNCLHKILIVLPLTAAAFSAAADGSVPADSVTLPGVVLAEVAVTTIKGGNNANADESATYIGRKAVEQL